MREKQKNGSLCNVYIQKSVQLFMRRRGDDLFSRELGEIDDRFIVTIRVRIGTYRLVRYWMVDMGDRE